MDDGHISIMPPSFANPRAQKVVVTEESASQDLALVKELLALILLVGITAFIFFVSQTMAR